MEIIKKICYAISALTKYRIPPGQAKELLGEQICILRSVFTSPKQKRVCYKITNTDESIILYVMRDNIRLALDKRAQDYALFSIHIYSKTKSNKNIWDNMLDKQTHKIFYAISNYYNTHTKTKIQGTNFLFMFNVMSYSV